MPWHGAGKGQTMHEIAMVVHPLPPLVKIVIEWIGIRNPLSQVGQGLIVGLRRPM